MFCIVHCFSVGSASIRQQEQQQAGSVVDCSSCRRAANEHTSQPALGLLAAALC